MEAIEPRRAALRLLGALAGVALTAALATVAVVIAWGRHADRTDLAALEPISSVVGVAPSYTLPGDEPGQPAAVHPVVEMIDARRNPAGFAYAEPERPLNASGGIDASGVWSGPVMIDNPAARNDGPAAHNGEPVVREARRMTPLVESHPRQLLEGPLLAATEPAIVEGIAPDQPTFGVAPSLPEVTPSPMPQHTVTPLTDDDFYSYTTGTNQLSKRLTPEVRAGFQLGKGGAVYAARERFLRVLREVAAAKDAEEGGVRHATALADGLRALEEADDFIPRGDVLETELDPASIAQSHATPLLHDLDHALAAPSPHEAVALYSRHAAQKLAEATAGEQAGSMALHGLGKSYARLSVQGGDITAGRKSAVTFRAAILAHSGNYLAANELGVYLARNGRYDQAAEVLRMAADQPGAAATVYTNLAEVEQKRGQQAAAANVAAEGQRVAMAEQASGEVSRRMGVQWMDAPSFRQTTVADRGGDAPSQQPAYATAGPAPTGSPWQSAHAPAASMPVATQAESANPFRRAMSSVRRATGWDRSTVQQPSQGVSTATSAPVQAAARPYPRVVR
jgi:tetratricopeptide (TPR) repeat protein